MTDLNEMADRVRDNARGWLPGVGTVVNVTFDESEAIIVERALREAALPTIARTLGQQTPGA